MKHNYFFPLVCLIFSVSLSSFSQNTLTGSVKNEQRQPVTFANVVLMENDSITVYKGAVTDEQGQYKFEDILSKDYVLIVSFVGYSPEVQKFEVNKDRKLEPIILKEDADFLTEVTINASNPTVSREIDRLVFNVENSTLSTGSSWDILRKTPGVIVSQNQLMVRNSVVAVYINDRKVHLSASELQQLLESYSAANIKSVEVITNPPARYEAEGGAILNIVTSTNLTPGYKGSVDGTYTQAIYPKYQFGTSHYFKTEKLNIFANYSFSPRKEFKNDINNINFINENGQIFSRWDTYFDRTTRSQAHNANVNMDYYLDNKNTLSFSSNILYSPEITFDNVVETTIRNRQFELDSTLVTNSDLQNDESNVALNLKYTHQFDTEGAQISADAHYTNYNQDRMQEVNSTYFSPQDNVLNRVNFLTDAIQEIDIFTAQIDFESPMGNGNLETGAKVSSIDSESGIDYFNTDVIPVQPINALSDIFRYDEKIYAGYASFARDWEKWALKAGLRGEYTDIAGTSASLGPVNNQEYFELFPTFYLQRSISDNHVLTFDYSRRIVRPRYQSLNPFRYFLTENNFNAGNPDLRAAVSNNFNLNYTLQGQYFFDLYYRDNGETPSTLAFQNNQNQTFRTLSANFLDSESYGLDFSHGRSITGFWYAQAFVSLFHEENTFLAVESNNAVVTNETDGVQAYVYNVFTLAKDGSFEGTLFLMHISDFISGSYQLDPMTTLSLGFRKTLWNNRVELTLNFEDVLNETNTRLTSQYLNQDNSFFAQEELRYVRFGFKYNFGNFRLSDNQKAIEAAERDRL